MLFVILSILVLVTCVTFMRNIYNRVLNIGDQLDKLVKLHEKPDKKTPELPSGKGQDNGLKSSGESTV